MMSYIKNGPSDLPIYESKIYEFHENDREDMKTFLSINPNLRCII